MRFRWASVIMAVVATFLAGGFLGGCAARTTSQVAAASGPVYRGEVWTWDTDTSVVTLRQGAQTIRVKVPPGEISQLRLHDNAALHGELVGPAEIAQYTVPTPPMNVVSRGPVNQTAMDGTIASVQPADVVALDSPHGRLTVWAAQDAKSRFASGDAAHLDVSVQHVDLVPATTAMATESAPSASPELTGGQPGDNAVVVGRVLASDPNTGIITVDSPRGPVTVWIPDARDYPAGTTVRLSTSIRRG